MTDSTTQQLLVNGNEAVAWAALVAGVDYFAHYPGSPVNLVEPALKRLAREHKADVKFNDALNEHIAALAAAGASFCGARSLLVMKHVGLNIAADPLNYIGYTGVKGGMVIVVGTDPGANSSTGEEDVHWYVPQFNFPLYEPTSIPDIFRYVQEAFVVSETYQLPVLVFLPTRICHNSAVIPVPVSFQNTRPPVDFYFRKDKSQYINVGDRAVRNHRLLVAKIEKIAQEQSRQQAYFNPAAAIGLITRGVTFGHAYEAITDLGLQDQVAVLNLDLVYPLHRASLLPFLQARKEVIIIEDQDGFVENQIKMRFFNDLTIGLYGKEYFPKYGEISFTQVHAFLAEKFGVSLPDVSLPLLAEDVPERLGSFCEGCPHTAAYYAIDQALAGLDGIIGGDIGCSSLPPFRADWLLCMNAGIGISQGMAHVLKNQTIVSTGGDGSFFHGGLLSLQSAVQNKINLIHIVLDNKTNAMTGHQPSPTSAATTDYRAMLLAMGVDEVIEVWASEPLDFRNKLKAELRKPGVKVFWVNGNCVMQPSPYMLHRRATLAPQIDNSKCGTCAICYEELACPAINIVEKGHRDLHIDLNFCVRCGVCNKICPNGAITIHELVKEV
jgi:indolepyruvate ferredoxin oxidoreductase, alpha subunit